MSIIKRNDKIVDGYSLKRHKDPILKMKKNAPGKSEGSDGQLSLRIISGKPLLFVKVLGDWLKVSQLTGFDQTGDSASDNRIPTSMPNEEFNKVIANNYIGAPIWVEYPFIISGGTHSRYYYADIDDGVNGRPYWNDYDTTPTGLSYRDVAGQFVVPQDCVLKGMRGCIANTGGSVNPTVTIFYGSVNEAASNTTLTAASSGLEVSITTLRVPYKFNEDFNINLSAGDIVVPTIKHSFTGGTQTYTGNLTLKYVTR